MKKTSRRKDFYKIRCLVHKDMDRSRLSTMSFSFSSDLADQNPIISNSLNILWYIWKFKTKHSYRFNKTPDCNKYNAIVICLLNYFLKSFLFFYFNSPTCWGRRSCHWPLRHSWSFLLWLGRRAPQKTRWSALRWRPITVKMNRKPRRPRTAWFCLRTLIYQAT